MSLLSWLSKKSEPPPPLHHPRIDRLDRDKWGWWKGNADASEDRLALYIGGTQIEFAMSAEQHGFPPVSG